MKQANYVGMALRSLNGGITISYEIGRVGILHQLLRQCQDHSSILRDEIQRRRDQ